MIVTSEFLKFESLPAVLYLCKEMYLVLRKVHGQRVVECMA
jgi:hypothetical protein